jgi:uncharacterized ferritin-like protein (DUF455 family)
MVAESAAILKRFYFLQRSLVQMQAGWVPGIEHWEHKLLLPEFLWEDALIAARFRERVLELRYPNRRIVPGEDKVLIAEWKSFANAPDGSAFVGGSLPAMKVLLRKSFSAYIAVADALDDGPTLRILQQALEDIERQLDRLARVPAPARMNQRWGEATSAALSALDEGVLLAPAPPALSFDWRRAEGKEFAMAGRAMRDPRFLRPHFAWPDRLDNARGPGEGVELQLRAAIHHVNEVWAAEMAAAVLHGFLDEAPPDFLVEGARWCYDEMRHCRMGYSRLLVWGFKPQEIPLDTFSYDASADADDLVRLGTIFYFETTYIHTKSERTKIFARDGDRLSAHDMDFDWADELIHTYYGSRWLKHFIEARRDKRSMADIKDAAHAYVRAVQQSATEGDRSQTEAIYQSLLVRHRELAAARA